MYPAWDGIFKLVSVSVCADAGTYIGCPVGGVEVTRSDLLVTTAAYPNLPPADQYVGFGGICFFFCFCFLVCPFLSSNPVPKSSHRPAVIWSCQGQPGARHLHINGASSEWQTAGGVVVCCSDLHSASFSQTDEQTSLLLELALSQSRLMATEVRCQTKICIYWWLEQPMSSNLPSIPSHNIVRDGADRGQLRRHL